MLLSQRFIEMVLQSFWLVVTHFLFFILFCRYEQTGENIFLGDMTQAYIYQQRSQYVNITSTQNYSLQHHPLNSFHSLHTHSSHSFLSHD